MAKIVEDRGGITWVTYETDEDRIQEIRETIRNTGFKDLREYVESWHVYYQWRAYDTYMSTSYLLEDLGYPGIPTCCAGEDHQREDGKVFIPGDPGAAPNWNAAGGETDSLV